MVRGRRRLSRSAVPCSPAAAWVRMQCSRSSRSRWRLSCRLTRDIMRYMRLKSEELYPHHRYESQPDAIIVLNASSEPDVQHLEKRFTPELSVQLHQVKSDALELYTEFCSKAAMDLKSFLGNVTILAEDTRQRAYTTLASSPEHCRYAFQAKLRKIELDAHKAATFSTETHHKFLLGHMIVFRMHLNKSEEYLRRCDRTARTCGVPCQSMSRQLLRWRRLAQCEINRVRDDVEHARKAYADLVVHAYRKLNHLRKHTNTKLQTVVGKLLSCAREPYQNDQLNKGV